MPTLAASPGPAAGASDPQLWVPKNLWRIQAVAQRPPAQKRVHLSLEPEVGQLFVAPDIPGCGW